MAGATPPSLGVLFFLPFHHYGREPQRVPAILPLGGLLLVSLRRHILRFRSHRSGSEWLISGTCGVPDLHRVRGLGYLRCRNVIGFLDRPGNLTELEVQRDILEWSPAKLNLDRVQLTLLESPKGL